MESFYPEHGWGPCFLLTPLLLLEVGTADPSLGMHRWESHCSPLFLGSDGEAAGLTAVPVHTSNRWSCRGVALPDTKSSLS